MLEGYRGELVLAQNALGARLFGGKVPQHGLGLANPLFGHLLEFHPLLGRAGRFSRHPQGRGPDLAHHGEMFCVSHGHENDAARLNHT